MADYLDLGKHAAFIWSAYGATAVGLIGMALISLRAHRKARETAERLRPRRKKPRSEEIV